MCVFRPNGGVNLATLEAKGNRGEAAQEREAALDAIQPESRDNLEMAKASLEADKARLEQLQAFVDAARPMPTPGADTIAGFHSLTDLVLAGVASGPQPQGDLDMLAITLAYWQTRPSIAPLGRRRPD